MKEARNTPPATGITIKDQRGMARLTEDDNLAICASFLTTILESEAMLGTHWL
jgi:hypothetical protein